MLREALEYIVGLGESKQHEINGSIYSDKELYRVDTYFPKALAIELNTLTGLVDYIKSSIDEMPGKMIVDVKDPETVRLYSQLDPNRDRETLVIVRARVPEFYFNRFINQEEFCINMQSKFIDDTATDRALLMYGWKKLQNSRKQIWKLSMTVCVASFHQINFIKFG